jgi:hypothetical protein
MPKKPGCFFFPPSTIWQGEAVVNAIAVMVRARLNGNYPFLPAVWNSNGRLKPNVALVNGKEQKVEGPYYLRYTEGGKLRFELVGGDAASYLSRSRDGFGRARDSHHLVPLGTLQQFRNDGTAQMAAGTTHTDFHVNLQYFRNEHIKFPATFSVISTMGFTVSRAPVASRRGKH